MSAFQLLRPRGASRYVLFCDHASNWVPAELDGLGLAESELARHIAWDIGAAGITEALSEILEATAILCGVSRLVIDCNRQLGTTDLVPEVSDGTVIPGNVGLSEAGKAERVARWFDGYHDAGEAVLQERSERETVVVSIHSMTEQLAGRERPWAIAVSSYLDRRMADPVLGALRACGGFLVGDNEPYDLDPAVDYTIPYHAMRRGVPHLQMEFRQDLVGEVAGQLEWARRFAGVLD